MLRKFGVMLRLALIASLLATSPAWSKNKTKSQGHSKQRRILLWTGLAVAGTGAALLATGTSYTVYPPQQQCNFYTVLWFCPSQKPYEKTRSGKQLAGGLMIVGGGVTVWSSFLK